MMRNKGITSIAIVIVIVVILILVGISILVWTEKINVLNRGVESKILTENMDKINSASLSNETEGENSKGVANKKTSKIDNSTTPYYPDTTFSYKEGDLDTGLVIIDSNDNEYVWVEVPKTIYDDENYNGSYSNKPSGNTDYENIE